MKKDFPKLFASVKDILILKRNISSSNNEKSAKVGDEFVVDKIVEYGFDLKSIANPEISVRLLNSEVYEYFDLKDKT